MSNETQNARPFSEARRFEERLVDFVVAICTKNDFCPVLFAKIKRHAHELSVGNLINSLNMRQLRRRTAGWHMCGSWFASSGCGLRGCVVPVVLKIKTM
jgi:hypothetical protein